jgi:hypothetical protein
MAIFKPEVRTVEGSNVGTYNPPTVDYSGIYSSIGQSIGTSLGSIFESSSRKGNLSEGDKETLALQDVASQYERANEIEDRVVRAVKLKGIYVNSLKEYTKYEDGMKELYATISGETYQGTGVDPTQIVQANAYKWATDSSEGQSSVALAQLKAGGDPVLMDEYIKGDYLRSLAYDNQIAAAEQRTKLMEAGEKERKFAFATESRPILQAQMEDFYKQDLSSENFMAIRSQAIKEGLDPIVMQVSALKVAREQRFAELTSKVNSMGLDPTTVNLESFMTSYDSTIKSLEEQKDVVSRAIGTMTDNQIFSASKIIPDPITRRGFQKGDPAITAYMMLNEKVQSSINTAVEYGIGLAGGSPSPDVAGPPSSRKIIADSGSEFADKNAGVASREVLMKTFSAPRSAQIELGRLGKDAILNYKFNPAVPEYTEGAYKNIASMYIAALPDIDKERSGIKFANMQKLIGDKAFETIEAIKSTNPNYGNDLYNQMNAYSLGAVESLTDAFVSNMVKIRDTDYNPFVLEMDKNNNIRLNINKDALLIDNNLKKAMGMYRYQTVPAGKTAGVRAVEVAPTETDPMKILSNYVSLLEGTNQNEIIDIVESLKLIAKQSSKIPAGFRTERDPLQIIKQNVTVLEK